MEQEYGLKPRKPLKIDHMELSLNAGAPFEFEGVHSGGQLSGIEVTVTVYSDDGAQAIDELFKKKTAVVDDVFVNRQYEATLHRKSSMYQEGRPGKTYRFEVRELDEAPQFEQLEIEGHTFAVIRNGERLHEDNVICLNILLRLSPDEFQTFQCLRRPGPITIRRVGIDESPIVRRFGGALYWSSHEEGSARFYKQIVRFFPTEYPPSGYSFASGQEQHAQSQMILALTARFEALVNALVENGHVSRETGETLASDEWRKLVDDERVVMMASKLSEVNDADLELD